eukprot:132118-Rhodomonas_salina.1
MQSQSQRGPGGDDKQPLSTSLPKPLNLLPMASTQASARPEVDGDTWERRDRHRDTAAGRQRRRDTETQSRLCLLARAALARASVL